MDVVIQGGQTMNPSMGDLLDAARRANASSIIILPNNGNIIMAAASAASAADFPVAVVPSKSVLQGFSAMFVFDASATIEANAQAMGEAIAGVHDGEGHPCRARLGRR